MTTEKRTPRKPITEVMGTAITRSGDGHAEARDDLRRAEIRQRQRSMLNAMLCCMI